MKSLSDFSKSLAPRARSTCSRGRPVHRASPADSAPVGPRWERLLEQPGRGSNGFGALGALGCFLLPRRTCEPVLVRKGAHGLPPHRYAMTLKRRSPGDMQAPNAVPEADWSRRSTSSWLSHAPPLLVWTAGSARTQWTRGPPHSLAHRGRRCLRSHASAGIQIGCMRYCAYCATPPTSDSQYQCARSGIDYIGLREFDAPCDN